MGRKGMKGFIKSAARPSAKPEEAASVQPLSTEASAHAAAGPSSPKKQQHKLAPAAGAPAPKAEPAGDTDGESGSPEQENRGQMLQRHKRELLAHRKTVQRTGKKSKDELAKLEAELEARHAKELHELDAAPSSSSAAATAPAAAAAAKPTAAAAAQATAATDGSAAAADKASKYLKVLDVADDDEGDEAAGSSKSKKQSKAQKRRDKAAAAAAEREARIAAELSSLGTSERVEEEQALKKLLGPLGLGIKEIRADGHCLYRSLEDQLEQTAAAAAAAAGDDVDEPEVPNYQELRELAAEHIRQHKDQFAPFLLPEEEEEDPEQHYESYCYALETTAAWGGHLELTALADALQRHIKVHAVGMASISLGEQYDTQPPLELCYLRHAFGLGEHYNSTKKLRFVSFAESEDVASDDKDEQQQEQEQAGGGGDGEEQESS